jgi:hypothetical protein
MRLERAAGPAAENDPPIVTRREWRWATGFALMVMAVTTVPYIVAAASQTPAWQFGGFLIAVDDGNSYLANMGEGARGAWLFTLPYSSEPQRGVLLYGFYLLLGRLAGRDHTALLLAYHAARIVCGVLLLLTSYMFLAEFLPRRRQRRLAVLLVAVGGGLGWLLVALFPNGLLRSLPVDFISPEAFSFLVLFAFPHLAAARCLFLLGLLAYMRGHGLLAGLALFAVGLIQPLSVIVAWAVVTVHLALSWRRQPSRGGWSDWRRRARAAIILGLLSAPMVVYTVVIFSTDPVLSQWNAQNKLPSPSPLHYVLAYGVWLLVAVPGWRVLSRRRPQWALLAGGWLLLAPVMLYAPIPTQRRLIEAIQVPLAALTVLGLSVALRRFRPWLTPAVLALCLPTSLIILLGAVVVARGPGEPIFHPADEVAAFGWLADHSQPGQVALSSYETGNVLPAYAPLVAYIGHGPETILLDRKAPLVAAFYQSTTADVDRRTLLATGRIRYVIFGPHERALGNFDPARAPYLQWRFAIGNYSIYEAAP